MEEVCSRKKFAHQREISIPNSIASEQMRFDDYALFFRDECGGDCIGVVFKPSACAPVKLNARTAQNRMPCTEVRAAARRDKLLVLVLWFALRCVCCNAVYVCGLYAHESCNTMQKSQRKAGLVQLNVAEIVDDFYVIGEGLVTQVYVNNDKLKLKQ